MSLSVMYGDAGAPSAPDAMLTRYEQQVRRHPHAVAVSDGPDDWSYAQLDAMADRLKRELESDVRPGDLVAVSLDRSMALVAVAVALAKIGAVYLPLGSRPGHRRLAAVADGLDVRCVIGDPALLPVGFSSGPTAKLSAPTELVAAFAAVAGTQSVPAGTFYCVLTSGSTGTPKAVAVGGAALDELTRWYAATTELAPGQRHSLLIEVSFDPHLMEMWSALTAGAALVIAPEAVRWGPEPLTTWWREAAITATILPTPLAGPVFDRPWENVPSLRHLVVGGDRLRRWPQKDVTARVLNAYGPAEATVTTTVQVLDPQTGDDATDPPIGLPIPGRCVCVVDSQGAVVPRGEAGELWIAGTGLALGYLDHELTARRFVAAPPEVGADRAYRSGDRVRMRPDGLLDYLGRMDDQIKINGVRTEPAEVELAFEHSERVREAVAVPRLIADGLVQVAVFLRVAGGVEVTPDQLLADAREWLPEQVTPSPVKIVEAFPLDANGKVDRQALLDRIGLPEPADENLSAIQRLVVDICRTGLGLRQIGIDDNFTAAGGASLAAARLMAALEEALGVRLRAPEILRAPSLRAIAELLESRHGGAEPVSGPPATALSAADEATPSC
jgi:amino acid adenylation domain-containing protein